MNRQFTPVLGVLCAAVLAAAATPASAQSSVTVYGRFNTTLERQDDGGVKSTALNNNSSRIGFKGTEDMGGGLKAGFQLEHGFRSDTGAAAATFWGRQTEVNLSGGFGMLRLGNFTSEAYYATADYVSNHNHDTGRSSDALYAYIGRNSNKIAYRLPEFTKDLSIEGSVALKESTAGATDTYDFAVNYALGPLALGAGYEKNDKANQFAVRALYDGGAFLVGGYIQRDKDGYGAGYGNRTSIRLSAAYMLGASEFHVNYGNAGNYSNRSNSKADQFTLGYNYKLSKRTKVYGYYTKVDDKAAAGKQIYGDSNSFALGVRHNF